MNRNRSTEVQSMNRWTTACHPISLRLRKFAGEFLSEERAKSSRLLQLARRIALPIYETRSFRFPQELAASAAWCESVCAAAGWSLAVRIVQNEQLVFRELGLSKAGVIAAAR